MEIFAVFNEGLSKSIMADGITSLAIYYRMFWTDYLIVLVMNLCQMLTIITMMLANIGIQLRSATTKTLKLWRPSWIAGYNDDKM